MGGAWTDIDEEIYQRTRKMYAPRLGRTIAVGVLAGVSFVAALALWVLILGALHAHDAPPPKTEEEQRAEAAAIVEEARIRSEMWKARWDER